jgi:hypothetical protein
MITFTKLDNGKLRLTASKGYKRELRQRYIDRGGSDTFEDGTESYWTNGWGIFSADLLGQLSSAPIIVEDLTINDDNSRTLNGNAWWYPDYQILDPVEEILKHKYVDFDLWDTFDNVTFPSIS